MKNPLSCLQNLIAVTLIVAATHLAGATTYLWNATDGVSANTNWSTTANWSPNGSPSTADTAVFGLVGNTGSSTIVNNVVNLTTTITALTFTNSTSGSWNVTDIPATVTLTVSGTTTVGFSAVASGTLVTDAAVTDAGTLVLAGSLTVGNNDTATAGSSATLDLSGLSNFVYNAAAGTIALSSGNRSSGNLLLAGASNNITAATINDNTAQSSSSGTGNLTLGAGTNSINVGAFNIAAGRGASTVAFPAGSTGGLRIRGAGGNGTLANLTLGNHNTSSSSGSSGGTLSLNGHPVDLQLGTLTLGESSATPTGTSTGSGTVSFDTGTIVATNILMAITANATSGNTYVAANGTINVGANATLIIGSGGMSLANALSSAAVASAAGALNITGGAVICSNNIVKASSVAAGTGAITVNGGSLTMVGSANIIGSPAIPVDNLTVNNSTMSLPVTVGAPAVAVTTLTINGTADTINISSAPAVIPPAQIVILKYSSLAAGTLDFGLGTLVVPYQGYISNNTINSSVDLVITNSTTKNVTWNGNVNGKWDLTDENWLFSGSPAYYVQGDSVTFDDTLKGTPNVVLALGSNVGPASISFGNVNTNYVLSGTNGITCAASASVAKTGAGTVTLTESGDSFNCAITVSGGTLILDDTNSTLGGALTISGGTVQIGNNDTNGALPASTITVNSGGVLAFKRTDNVTVGAITGGAGSLVQSGTGTNTLTGANTYTGNTTVSAGTLALSGSGTISNSAAVSVTSATFDVSGLSQPPTTLNNSLTISGATIKVAISGVVTNINCATLTFAGATNYVSVASLPPIASYPVTFTLIQSAIAASGTFNVGLGAPLPNGSSGYVTQSADQTAVLLTVTSGTVGVRPEVGWTGADAATSINWSDRLNWQLPGEPGAGENVIFTPTDALNVPAISPVGGGASSLYLPNINNIVDGNVTMASLTFTNVGGLYHNTWINNGLTLSVTGTNSNALTVGGSSSSVDFGAGATEFVTIAGTNGTLLVNNTNGTVYVGLGNASAGTEQATLDLSALGTFNANISRMLVAVGGSAGGLSIDRASGIVYLAQTNTIVASLPVSGTETIDTSASAIAFGVGEFDANPGETSYLYLGQTNAIFADSICVARQKASARMLFNPAFTSSSVPSAYFRGRSGGSVPIWSLGDGVVQSATANYPITGVNDFTGGAVNAQVSTLYVGRAANSTAGSSTATGTLSFDNGLFDVTTIYLGYQPTNTGRAGVGTINVNSNATAGAGATLRVEGNLNLGVSTGGAGAASTTGTLNLNNGTAFVSALVPGANSTINLAGGWLVLTNPAGNTAVALATLDLASLGTPDNSATLLSLPVRTNNWGLTVGTLNIDGLTTTTNIIAIESVGPVGPAPVELPLIKYSTLNNVGGTFNIGLAPLPNGYTGYLTNDTTLDPAIALVLTSAVNPQPRITAFSLQSGTNLVVSGVNGYANIAYAVLTSTNVALPLANWTTLGSGIFGPDGSFSSTATVTASSQQFFRLRVLP